MRKPPKRISCESKINNSSGQIGIIIIFLFLILFSVLVGRFVALKPPLLVIGLIGGLIIGLITLVNTDLALIILIFSMLLSPEIPIFQVPERAVVVRIDDILLIFVFFTWLAKIATNKQLGLLRKTCLNLPLFIYLFICILSTTSAIILGISKAKFSTAFFYILKITEYFMLYFLVVNNIKDIKQIKKCTVFILLVSFLICIYGYYQIKTGVFRVYAPFEGEHPEPNTLAGYLLLMFALTSGLLIHIRSIKHKFLLGGLISLTIPIFLNTFSRGGYLGFLAVYLSLIVLSKKSRFILIILALFLLFLTPTILPLSMVKRIRSTFIPGKEYELLGTPIALDWSAAMRVEMAKRALAAWQKSPLFGYGITGLGFLEGQYTRLLAEVGIVGISIFFWLFFRLFRNVFRTYRFSKDEFVKGMSLGLLVGLIGLLVHAVSASVFIIVRIMEPFWFLAAMVVMLPELQQKEIKM